MKTGKSGNTGINTLNVKSERRKIKFHW